MTLAAVLRTDCRVVRVEAEWPCRRLLSNPGDRSERNLVEAGETVEISYPRYRLKIEPMRSAEGLDVECEKKKRIRGDPGVFSLSTWKSEVAINGDR